MGRRRWMKSRVHMMVTVIVLVLLTTMAGPTVAVRQQQETAVAPLGAAASAPGTEQAGKQRVVMSITRHYQGDIYSLAG